MIFERGNFKLSSENKLNPKTFYHLAIHMLTKILRHVDIETTLNIETLKLPRLLNSFSF